MTDSGSVDIERVRRSEAIRGYRLISLEPFRHTCLACEKEVAEGDWCCIGWTHHLELAHQEGSFVTPERLEELRKKHGKGISLGSCRTCQRKNDTEREEHLRMMRNKETT